MNALIILLAQTKGVAVIEILLLLIVAAIIGYVTAWLYTRSVYNKKLKIVEDELEVSISQISRLNAEKSRLQKNLDSLIKENQELILKEQALKVQNKEAVIEIERKTLKKQQAEQLLDEKEEELLLIAQRRHLLDYNSFGTAEENEKDDLQMISGIGPSIE